MMRAERILLQSVLDSTEELSRVARLIQDGAVFVYPTETIYGIGGRSDLQSVMDRVYEAKNRPAVKSVILIASRKECFSPLELHYTPAAEILMKKFWPGLLTLVLPSDKSPEGTAIRVSDHPFISAIFSLIKTPLISTSANLSGQSYDPDPEHIFEIFRDKVDFMIDAGFLPPSPPSTVIKAGRNNEISPVREGAVRKSVIDQFLKEMGF
ncbi:MAG TPA: L-threonylcarbamoyladenylate synthase [Chitinispirillaceae bacterium]|nr:L-threonylcarbamoyladenylate synthase [Chitinispirillaceae bacterium]